MNDVHLLSQQVETIYGRLSELYHNVSNSEGMPAELFPVALKELGVASEELQVMVDQLFDTNTQLSDAYTQLGSERDRYQDLFEFIPDGFLVTDAMGMIQEANRVAGELLNVQPRFLVGKPLISLVAVDDRAYFRSKVLQLDQRDRLELSLRLQRRYSNDFEATVVVKAGRREANGNRMLQWLVRDVSERKRAEAALTQSAYDPCQDRSLCFYGRGEMIPLEPQTIWMVGRGVVKLTTLSDCGTEMLVGLAADSMVFGASLTTLPIYQAVALVDVQLAAIPMTELAQSPRLVQVIFPSIKQRLQQTESFLAIYGQIRVEDRLNRLLQLLKREIGEATESGVRLRARLTHQDLASACCTTRVTITRLLRKLQEQGTLTLDSHNHLVIQG